MPGDQITRAEAASPPPLRSYFMTDSPRDLSYLNPPGAETSWPSSGAHSCPWDRFELVPHRESLVRSFLTPLPVSLMCAGLRSGLWVSYGFVSWAYT